MASKKHNDPIQDAQFKDTAPKQEVAVIEQPPEHHQQVGNPLDMPVQVFKDALERRSANRTALMRTIKDMLIVGVDYGPIHVKKKGDCKYYGPPDCTPEKEPYHWSKPVLFKPGAEKICGFLGVTTIYPNYPEYERAALEGTEVKQIILRCHLVSGGNVVADGIGARHIDKDHGDLNKALKMASKCLGGRTPVLIKHENGAVRTDIHRMSQYNPDELYIAGPNASWRKVVDIRKQTAGAIRRITVRSGLEISASLDHHWPLSDGRLVATSNLNVGDVLQISQLPAGEGNADEDIAWVSGLFLAQGTIDEPFNVRFHLHAEDVHQATRVAQLAERLGANCSDTIVGNKRVIRVCGTAICGVMRQFVIGDLSYGKHFSRWLFRQNPKIIAAALDGYLHGDGHYAERDGRQPHWVLGFTGKNRELADDLRTICAILGYRCKIAPGTASNQSGKSFSTYHGWIKDTEPLYNAAELGEIVSIETDHKVTYEVEVDGDHLFCLANGLVTHNSAHIAATLNMAGLSEVFTQDLDDMFPEGKPPAPAGAGVEPEPTTLTMAQVTAIDRALDNYTPAAKDKFIKTICKAYQVEVLAEISAKLYDEVLARIDSAKQKAAKPSSTRVV